MILIGFNYLTLVIKNNYMLGVVGVYSREDATRKALHNLYGVQSRGQESAGISAAGDHSLRTFRGKGLVSNVFDDDRFKPFIHPDDYVAIGSASGEDASFGYISPVEFESRQYKISLAMDGFVLDRGEKSNEEVFGGLFLKNLEKRGDVDRAFSQTMEELQNAYYSLVMALWDKDAESSEVVVARDRRGLKPLYVGLNESELFAVSESPPLDVLESMGGTITERRDVIPGSMIRYDGGFNEEQVLEPRRAHCAFEWVYFGRPDSVIEGQTVHTVRKRLGHALVKEHSIERKKDTVIIPVPDSGRSVCVGVGEALGVVPDEGVIKNAYLGRTYIIFDPEFRKTASDLKHNIIREVVEGKRVIITDDSIVRGTVSESIAQNLIRAGADEVEYFVSYAPIFYPCFPDRRDKPLAAAPYKDKALHEIEELVASNLPSIKKVRYNSPENVVKAIGLPKDYLCTFCITQENPFED